MDIKKIAREIGVFETALNVEAVGITDVLREKAGTSFPLPSGDTRARCDAAAKWLVSFGKKKYLFLTPEIALIEAMARCTNKPLEAIIMIPCDMDSEAEERLLNNLPRAVKVHTLKEPYFPDRFIPMNGMVVVCGYMAREHLQVFPETYRMIEHYGNFSGRQVFVPYIELASADRYDGWIETNVERFNTAVVWEGKYTFLMSPVKPVPPLVDRINRILPVGYEMEDD